MTCTHLATITSLLLLCGCATLVDTPKRVEVIHVKPSLFEKEITDQAMQKRECKFITKLKFMMFDQPETEDDESFKEKASRRGGNVMMIPSEKAVISSRPRFAKVYSCPEETLSSLEQMCTELNQAN